MREARLLHQGATQTDDAVTVCGVARMGQVEKLGRSSSVVCNKAVLSFLNEALKYSWMIPRQLGVMIR
jgi:hypothetical protein